MMQRVSRTILKNVGRRGFSDVSTLSPKAIMMNNMAIIEAQGAATTADELKAALSATATIESSESTSGGASDTWQEDPTAWQNMQFWDYVSAEANRDNTYPFVIGGIVTYLLLGVGLHMATATHDPAKSKYISIAMGHNKH